MQIDLDETLPVYPPTIVTHDVFSAPPELPDVLPADCFGEITIANPTSMMDGYRPFDREQAIYECGATTIRSLRNLEDQLEARIKELAPYAPKQVAAYRPQIAIAFLAAAIEEIQQYDHSEDAEITVYRPFIIDPILQTAITEDACPNSLYVAFAAQNAASLSTASTLPHAPDRQTLVCYAPGGTLLDEQLDGQPLCHVAVHAQEDRLRSALRLSYDSMLLSALESYARLATNHANPTRRDVA